MANEQYVEELVGMGFDRDLAIYMLIATDNNLVATSLSYILLLLLLWHYDNYLYLFLNGVNLTFLPLLLLLLLLL